MEYQIKEIIKVHEKLGTVSRGKRIFQNYPNKFDEIIVQVGEKQVKTEIVYIEDNIIFVEKITL